MQNNIFKPFTIASLLCLGFCAQAWAEKQEAQVLNTSSSGRTITLNIGSSSGLHNKEAILLRSQNQKVASARIIRITADESTAYIVENYTNQPISTGSTYNILYGAPAGTAALSSKALSREEAAENPQTEKFFTADGDEINQGPELDDEKYMPETSIHPKLPDAKVVSTHNITFGPHVFRTYDLNTYILRRSQKATTTHQGYSARYAYNFRTYYWFQKKTPAILSTEMGLGSYSFSNRFPDGSSGRITVMPLFFDVRYLIELSRVFRIYPYLGYLQNMVSATDLNSSYLAAVRGGRLMAGGGAQLVLSEDLDARLDMGVDGMFLGLVAKF